jgi:hypothetical protein
MLQLFSKELLDSIVEIVLFQRDIGKFLTNSNQLFICVDAGSNLSSCDSSTHASEIKPDVLEFGVHKYDLVWIEPPAMLDEVLTYRAFRSVVRESFRVGPKLFTPLGVPLKGTRWEALRKIASP